MDKSSLPASPVDYCQECGKGYGSRRKCGCIELDIENYAAMLEAQQANSEYCDAYWAFIDGGKVVGSAEDYAMWSLAGYADAADKAAIL